MTDHMTLVREGIVTVQMSFRVKLQTGSSYKEDFYFISNLNNTNKTGTKVCLSRNITFISLFTKLKTNGENRKDEL